MFNALAKIFDNVAKDECGGGFPHPVNGKITMNLDFF